jgi:hypothetical protein
VQPNAFGCFISLFSYGDTLTFTHTCYASKGKQPEVRSETSFGKQIDLGSVLVYD